MSRADREKSSGSEYPESRTNEALMRLNSPSKAMMDSGSIERSKNSSSSVSACDTCGGLATSTRSFRSHDYRLGPVADGAAPAVKVGKTRNPATGFRVPRAVFRRQSGEFPERAFRRALIFTRRG